MSREQEFKEELKTLLGKYQVQMSIETTTKGNWYPEYNIEFYGDTEYKNNDGIHEAIDFEVSYFDKDGER